MRFIEQMKERARQNLKTICLPEASDLRTIEAASIALREGYANIILLGDEEETRRKAEENGLPLTIYSQTLGSFNKPTKFFEMLVRSGKCIIDKNPAVEWCLCNCELAFDFAENCKPVKANGDKNRKIDSTIAMLEGLGCYLNSKYFVPESWVI